MHFTHAISCVAKSIKEFALIMTFPILTKSMVGIDTENNKV